MMKLTFSGVEQIFWFKITVSNVVVMEKLDSQTDILHYLSSLLLRERLLLLDSIEELSSLHAAN